MRSVLFWPTPDCKLPKVVCVIARLGRKCAKKRYLRLNQQKMQRRRFLCYRPPRKEMRQEKVSSSKPIENAKTTVWFAPHWQKEKETKTTVWFAPHWQRERRKKKKKQRRRFGLLRNGKEKSEKKKRNKVPVKCTKESKTDCKIQVNDDRRL